VCERESPVAKARQLSQFKHFLRPVPFCQLCQAAAGGQVIIINISEHGMDALIFDGTRPIVHVPFPQTDIETLSELAGDIVLHRPTIASEPNDGSSIAVPFRLRYERFGTIFSSSRLNFVGMVIRTHLPSGSGGT